MQEIRFTLSVWHHEKLKTWADENGMTVRAALRLIINQFIKTGQFNLLKQNNE